MIVVSSISPTHLNHDRQQNAVDSWNKVTSKCYSLNRKEEIETLSPIYKNITFIETDRTTENFGGKKLVCFSAMLDFAKQQNEDLVIVNSDIVIDTLPEFRKDGITIFNRYDYRETFADATLYEHGYDLFFVPKEFLGIFPPFIYGMGNCFVDYSLPYRATLKGLPVYCPEGKYIYHKVHQPQWNYQEWLKAGQFFKWEFNFEEHLRIEEIAERIFNELKRVTIKR